MNLARTSGKLFLANILGAALSFLGIVFFARELGASKLGAYFLFQALLGMLAIPADLGISGAVEKRISEGEFQGAFLMSSITLKLVPIILIVLSILLFRPLINNYLGAELAVYLALGIVLQELAQLAVVVLKGELRVGETAVLNVIRQGTWIVGGAILVSFNYGVEAPVYSLLTGLGLMSVWGWYKSSVSPELPSVAQVRSLVDYGKYNIVSSIGGYFYSWMDVAIIGLFLTQTDVGAYEVAWRVTSITMLLSSAIASTIFPQVSQWDTKDAEQKIESIIERAIIPSMVLVIPAFFGILVFSNEILSIVFGGEYTIASIVLIILAGEKILQSIHIIIGRALQGIDRPNLAARATVISLCLNLIFNIVLVLSFGIVGAAIATTLAFTVNTVLHGKYLSRFVAIKLPYAEIGWCVLSSAGMALLLLGLQAGLDIENLPQLLFSIFIGSILYGAFLTIYPPIRRDLFTIVAEFSA